MVDLVDAQCVEPGQLLFQRSGIYLVDSVEVRHGIAYIGTSHGVLTLSATAPVFVTEPPA